MNIGGWFLAIVLEVLLVVEIHSSNSCDLDIENTLRTLLTQDEPSLQVRVLRRDLLKKLLEEIEEDMKKETRERISLPTISNNLPYEMKKNLESLARAGYIKTLPDEDDTDASFKRSIAYLAKNGQLPSRMNEKEKKGIESLARNGDLQPRRNMRQLLEDLYDKRNIASLARDYNFPVYGKRSISSLAKSGDLAYTRTQRNTEAVKRDISSDQDNIQKQNPPEDKRNLQSIKAQLKPKSRRSINDDSSSRNKRETDYFYMNEEFPSPVYQSQNVYDYDDLLQEINEAGIEKRFLGRLPQMGTSKPTPTPKTRHYL